MLALPMWVHESWRAEFDRRWRRSRPPLVLGFGLTPLLVVVPAFGILAARGALGPLALLLGLLAIAPIPYLWWFLLAGRVAVSTDYWGTRIGGCGALQALGLELVLQAAPHAVGGYVRVLPLPAFVIAVLGGLLAWRAHRILLDETGGALAATGLTLDEAIFATVGPTTYAGLAKLDGTSLSWSIQRGGSFSWLFPKFADRVWLRDVLDARVVRIADPARVPPVGYLPDGRPIAAPQGELLVVRTSRREVGVPVAFPRRLNELLRVRCGAIRSSRTVPQR